MKSYRIALKCTRRAATATGGAHGKPRTEPRTRGNADFTTASRTRALAFGTLLPATQSGHPLERAQ
jgi:hypothetical protein